MNEIILDIIKFSIPALLVFATVYVMLGKQAKKEERLRLFELKKKHSKESMPIRLQAFERLTLLMHRLAPENLIPRIQNPSMDVKTYNFALLKTVKSEFEHNITQQIYVSTKTWGIIENYKNNLNQLIRKQASAINPDEKAIKLSESILNSVIENPEQLEYQIVMEQLKKEVKELFI